MQNRHVLFPCFGLVIAAAALLGTANARPQTGGVETSGKHYKNIKVLRDLPADKLIPTMHEINTALNVRCDFCHETTVGADGKRTGYESDAKPMKNKAREMMRMMNSLNKSAKTIGGQATCYMCHHGHPEPQTSAPPEPSK